MRYRMTDGGFVHSFTYDPDNPTSCLLYTSIKEAVKSSKTKAGLTSADTLLGNESYMSGASSTATDWMVGKEIEISLTAGSKVDIQVYGHPYTLERGTELKINMPMCQ